MDLSTTYMGLSLRHPLICGASPLSDELGAVRRLEDAGAAAIVLRSLFEEQITREQVATFVHTELHGPETVDLTPFIREDLLLNLPAHPHCDRDGDRVCKAKQIKTAEQEVKRKSDWSALDKLKL